MMDAGHAIQWLDDAQFAGALSAAQKSALEAFDVLALSPLINAAALDPASLASLSVSRLVLSAAATQSASLNLVQSSSPVMPTSMQMDPDFSAPEATILFAPLSISGTFVALAQPGNVLALSNVGAGSYGSGAVLGRLHEVGNESQAMVVLWRQGAPFYSGAQTPAGAVMFFAAGLANGFTGLGSEGEALLSSAAWLLVTCLPLAAPVYGSVTGSGKAFKGDTRSISCDQGYSRVGSATVTCLAFETWSPVPTCQRES